MYVGSAGVFGVTRAGAPKMESGAGGAGEDQSEENPTEATTFSNSRRPPTAPRSFSYPLSERALLGVLLANLSMMSVPHDEGNSSIRLLTQDILHCLQAV